MTFQSHRQGKNKQDELYRESLSISDEDLREVEEEKSSSEGRELQTRPEFKSRDDEQKGDKQPAVTAGKLVSATEEIIHWEQIQTQETVRPVMLKRVSSSNDSEDLSVGKARDLAQDIVGKVI